MKSSSTDRRREARARLAQITRSICCDSFRDFAIRMWSSIPMTNPLILPSVAFDGVCAALQAVADGRIKRLVIDQPPGTAKSVLGSVGFPAYLYLASDGTERVMCGSFSHGFALRDATRCRDLMISDDYRALVAGRWSIRPFPDRVDDFWLTNGGRRMIVSPAGSGMGERCTVQIIDDAVSAAQAYSKAAKQDATRWVSTALTSRLEDQDRDRRVMIAQRLATDDPPQWAIDRGWKCLNLTAILGRDANLDPIDEAPCELYDDDGVLVWRDPRKPGETVSPLLSENALKELRIDMGSAAFSAQYLQKPLPAGGGMFKREWFEIVDAAPRGGHAVRAWDLAASTEKTAAYTAGVKIRDVDGELYIEDCRAIQGTPKQVEDLILETAELDGADVQIDMPQDPGQAGKAQKSAYAKLLRKFVVRFSPETGSKEGRAAPFAAQAEASKVKLVRGNWNAPYLDELEGFPNARFKDRVDASSRAYAALIKKGSSPMSWSGPELLEQRW